LKKEEKGIRDAAGVSRGMFPADALVPDLAATLITGAQSSRIKESYKKGDMHYLQRKTKNRLM
jgi:hypothetical protein